MYEIEKGIAPPAIHARAKYPFAVMEIGDSFFVPATEEEHKKLAASVRMSASQFARRNRKATGKKFTTRSVTGGVRCWRIA